jgi:magnesium-transporting ATPase (P-type)
MQRPPDPPSSPLLNRSLALRTFLFFGLLEAILGLVGFFGYYVAEGWRALADFAAFAAVQEEAATMTFLGIVAGQIGCLLSQRDGCLRAPFTENK